jgi:hypothetical protein
MDAGPLRSRLRPPQLTATNATVDTQPSLSGLERSWEGKVRISGFGKADQPIALGDVRFRGTSELALSTCDAARPSVAAAPLYPGWHRHRTVLADAAPRLLGGMGLRRGAAPGHRYAY